MYLKVIILFAALIYVCAAQDTGSSETGTNNDGVGVHESRGRGHNKGPGINVRRMTTTTESAGAGTLLTGRKKRSNGCTFY